MANARSIATAIVLVTSMLPSGAAAQTNAAKTGYYLSLGDSVAAGEGALPVTRGFVYQLYDEGAFAPMRTLNFSNIAIRGATADEVLAFQVPQALCIQPPRIATSPTVITLIAGANDFLGQMAIGVPSNPTATIPAVADGIAAKVEAIIRALVFGVPNLPAYCATAGLPDVVVLVGNYYGFNHPDPQIQSLFDLALKSFRASLAARITTIQADIISNRKTAKVAYVDLFSALNSRPRLINRTNGAVAGLKFEKHPTTAGHTAIAREFERAWKELR